MMEVIARKDEIFFSEKIRKDVRTRELIDNYKKLIEEILSYLESAVVEQIKQRPRYIHTMGDSDALSITRVVHEGEEGERASKDYDFSWKSIEERKEKGYKTAKEMLEKGAIHKRSKQRA